MNDPLQRAFGAKRGKQRLDRGSIGDIAGMQRRHDTPLGPIGDRLFRFCIGNASTRAQRHAARTLGNKPIGGG